MKIKPLEKKDLKLVEEQLKNNSLPWIQKLVEEQLKNNSLPGLHSKKLKEQLKGDSLWLIAWRGKEPIAHVQIRFKGSTSSNVKLRKCPHIETLYVKEKYRKQGVATKIMNFCEELIKKKKYSRVGLAVEKEDKFLLDLYKKRGYQDWKKGIIIEKWTENKKQRKEECKYLIKKLK
jgi:ribosomal protein S18 acetylase RimI-like enzyme